MYLKKEKFQDSNLPYRAFKNYCLKPFYLPRKVNNENNIIQNKIQWQYGLSLQLFELYNDKVIYSKR